MKQISVKSVSYVLHLLLNQIQLMICFSMLVIQQIYIEVHRMCL